MPPRPDRAASAWLRSATIMAPSCTVRMPATVAAAISPWEWPTTASGTTPAACQAAASDTITAHNAGCTTSARSGSTSPASTCSRSQSTYRPSARPHAASRAANTGHDTARSRPIPAHWPP